MAVPTYSPPLSQGRTAPPEKIPKAGLYDFNIYGATFLGWPGPSTAGTQKAWVGTNDYFLLYTAWNKAGIAQNGYVNAALVPPKSPAESLTNYATRISNRNSMATTAPKPPTQTQTNSSLTSGLDTAMRYIDSLTQQFQTVKGAVLGTSRAAEPTTNPTKDTAGNAYLGGMSNQTLLLIGAAVVLFFLLRKKL